MVGSSMAGLGGRLRLRFVGVAAFLAGGDLLTGMARTMVKNGREYLTSFRGCLRPKKIRLQTLSNVTQRRAQHTDHHAQQPTTQQLH
jgi:hypothetical protein